MYRYKKWVTSVENKDVKKNMTFQINTTTRFFKALVFTTIVELLLIGRSGTNFSKIQSKRNNSIDHNGFNIIVYKLAAI